MKNRYTFTILTFAAAVLSVLFAPASGVCGLYEFSDGSGRFRYLFYAYVDGVEIDGWDYRRADPHVASHLTADVDANGLALTFTAARAQQKTPVEASGIAKELGFGGREIPFTLLLNSSFSTDVPRSPFAINPAGLIFDTSESDEGQPSGVLTYAGYIDFDGARHDLNASLPMMVHRVGTSPSSFDDSGYPDELAMDLQGLWWDLQSPAKLFERPFGDSVFELHMTRASAHAYGSYDGVLIPEPSTLTLLATGLSALGLIVYRRRRGLRS